MIALSTYPSTMMNKFAVENQSRNTENLHNCLNNAQKQNIGRIADAVLFFANQIYGSNSFRLPVSRQDLADLTGVSRESASRILTDFHEEKILEIKGRQISILNEHLLKQISEKG
jgi:CRP-like cAMP-binding protein